MDVLKLATKSANSVLDSIAGNYIAQGHNNTGKGLKSMRVVTHFDGNDIVCNIVASEHVRIVDRGVKPNRIAYYTNSGKKSSKAVDGLIKYFMSKGKSAKVAKGLAFATLKVQKREGMSTKNSRRYSKTGRRNNFTRLYPAQKKAATSVTASTFRKVFRYST